MMIFRAELRDGLNLTAPNTTGEFPWGTTSALVINRPLFAWENGNTQIMRILANGNVGVGTTTPTTRFHTFGSLRFESIPTVTTNNYVLTADENGNVSRQLSTTFGGGAGIINNCPNVNYLTKQDATGITCSQIIDDGVNVGIGTASPSYKLDVNGVGRFGYALIGTNIPAGYYQDDQNGAYRSLDASGNKGYYFQSYNGVSTTMFVGLQGLYSGNVGIGTSAPAYKLDVNGTIRCNDLTTLSDGKYKKDVKSVNDALSMILKLEGKTYKWKKEEFKNLNLNDKLQYGLIAQDVEKVLPSLA